MKFQFRYETLLSYRKYLKERAEIELAKAKEEYEITKRALNELVDKFHTINSQLEGKLTEKIEADRLKNYSDYLLALKRQIEGKQIDLIRCEEKVDKARKVLLNKNKEWKILDTLKERDYRRWLEEQNRQEQKELSEMSILRFGRDFL